MPNEAVALYANMLYPKLGTGMGETSIRVSRVTWLALNDLKLKTQRQGGKATLDSVIATLIKEHRNPSLLELRSELSAEAGPH